MGGLSTSLALLCWVVGLDHTDAVFSRQKGELLARHNFISGLRRKQASLCFLRPKLAKGAGERVVSYPKEYHGSITEETTVIFLTRLQYAAFEKLICCFHIVGVNTLYLICLLGCRSLVL